MRVIATALGYDGRALRQPGEEFDMPAGVKGSWFEPKEVAPPVISATPGRKTKAKEAAPAEGDDLA